MTKSRYGIITALLTTVAMLSLLSSYLLPGILPFVGIVKAFTAIFTMACGAETVALMYKEMVAVSVVIGLYPMAKKDGDIEFPDTNSIQEKIIEIITLLSLLLAVFLI